MSKMSKEKKPKYIYMIKVLLYKVLLKSLYLHFKNIKTKARSNNIFGQSASIDLLKVFS